MSAHQFLRLFALAQRPGTPQEGLTAVAVLAKRMSDTYPVVWTVPPKVEVLIPGVHPVTGAREVTRYAVVNPMVFEDQNRVKTPVALALLDTHRYLWFRRSDVSYYCKLTDVSVTSL